MITRAQIEKLGALHAVESTMLSLYLAVPPSTNLTARAGELIAAAEAACGRPLAARDRDWVLEKLSPCVRDCTGRTVAVFACAGSGRRVAEFNVPGEIGVVELSRAGHSKIPEASTLLEDGDVLSFIVAAASLGRLRSFLGEKWS
jgi:hypothetical protein